MFKGVIIIQLSGPTLIVPSIVVEFDQGIIIKETATSDKHGIQFEYGANTGTLDHAFFSFEDYNACTGIPDYGYTFYDSNAKSIGSTTHTNPIRGKVKAKTFLGNLTGDVTGATSGIHTGYVIGNVTGATSGIHTGSVICNLTGIVTGDVIGNVRGNIQSVISALNTFDIRTTTASLFGITGNVTITNTDIRARLVKLYEY